MLTRLCNKFGVWEGKKLEDVSGTAMCAAVAVVYGPRCTMWVSASGVGGATEFSLNEDGNWIQTNFVESLSKSVRIFAPANLRCAQDDLGYSKLVEYYMKNRYTLRYSGGLVPDVCQIFTRGGGVFTSPVSKRAKAKLRILYEVMPWRFLLRALVERLWIIMENEF